QAQLIVMNRSGSLVVADSKGRDRERYPIVYGARLKVRDGQKVEQGQVLVEWDPYTFSILTEEPGIAKFKDIIDGPPCTKRSTRSPGCRGSSSSTRRTRRSSRRSRSRTRRARSCGSTTCRRTRTSWCRTANRWKPATCWR